MEIKMTAYIEHANITVPDIDAAIEFLQTIAPQIKVLHDETPEGSYRWAHVGIGPSYIALQEPHLGSGPTDNRRPYKDYGVNHIGWVVDDLDAVTGRLEANGYKKGIPGEGNPYRTRAYYFDSAGFEWEIVQYHTEAHEERFSYD
jgi:catechol 2,3-dioxygenase-like lactoylglutathione lyase family enzyme